MVYRISKIHCKNCVQFDSLDHSKFIFENKTRGSDGVAFFVNKKLTKYVVEYMAVSDRIIKITVNCIPFKVHLNSNYTKCNW